MTPPPRPWVLFLGLAGLAVAADAARAQSLSDPFQRSFEGVVNNDQETTSGAAWSDVDGDGAPDLFVSAYLDRDNFLYLNGGEGVFRRAEEGLLVSDAGLSSGAAWADVDNDGDDDLFVANQQGQDNFLYRNRGAGDFERIDGPVHRDRGDSYGGSWADFDGDGWVDLFVGNRSGQADFLYRNRGGGRFERVRSGPVVEAGGSAYSGAWSDYDGDGDPDLFVPDSEPDRPSSLYRNLGGGRFERVTEGPIAVDAARSSKAAWGDYDNDGDPDLLVTNGGFFSGAEEAPFLYRNDDGRLVRVLASPVVRTPISGSDAVWLDLDDDADLDLVVAAYRDANLVFRNDGEAGFVRLTRGWAADHGGFTDALAVADPDRDGDLDLYVTHWEAQNDQLLTNRGNENHWLSVRLEGTESNRAAFGARVRATAVVGGREVTQTREVGIGRAARGQDAREVHFGLGDARQVREMTIRWPSGRESSLGPLEADRFLVVREGAGVVSSEPAREAAPEPTPARDILSAFRAGGPEEALAAYQGLEGRVPEERRHGMLSLVLRHLFDNVDRTDGLALARAAVERAGGRPGVVFTAAEVHRAAGERERARALYRRVLELLPDARDVDPDRARWMRRTSERYVGAVGSG